MAIESVGYTEGSGKDIAVDTIGGLEFQVVKLSLGADGANDTLVDSGQQTMANSVPIAIASDQTVIPVADNGGSLTVDGSVTANAGTNLNTSALALEAGGNLAAVAASASVLDDWDESDRAKVNPIVGQAGVQGASGAVTALTQRVVLATDVALPAGTNAIGKLSSNAGVTIGAVEVAAAQTLATVTTVGTLTGGGVADSAADSGNPVKVGARAVNAIVTGLANNDRADALANLLGQILVAKIDPAMQVKAAISVSTTQTGTDVLTPSSGKKLAITSLLVSTGATTAGRMVLWFGDNADTTYSAGTDQALAVANFVPSSTSKPGFIQHFDPPVYCTTADRELHLTTDAGITLDITVYGFEWV